MNDAGLHWLLDGLLALLGVVFWRLVDSYRKNAALQIAAAQSDAAEAKRMAHDHGERIHKLEIELTQRSGAIKELERVVELQFSQQNAQLDRIELNLGQKVSKGEFKAATRVDDRREPDTDPPPLGPMRPRLPSRR